MADLSVTIGLDQTELEKGLANAGKSIGKMAGKDLNPFQEKADKFQSAAGIGGMIAGPVGALVGSFVDAWRFAIDKVIDYVKELIAYATKLRNISIATGVSIGQLEKLEGVAQASGVSLDTLARSINEFNRRMGEARIKGSEVNNVLVKLGVGMDQVADGSFDAIAGMKALAKAHDAGTDAATLAYYGNKMFGSSFEQLLPIIKRGSDAIDQYGARTWRNTETATYALARMSDEWDNFWHNFKVVMLEGIGAIAFYIQTITDLGQMMKLRAIAVVAPSVAGALAEKTLSPSLSKEARKMQLEVITATMSDKDKKYFMDAYESASGGKGKKLSPFGMSEAGAASTMQQMGGGDIFGAVAFTPLERIAKASEETAQNTKPKDETPSRTIDQVAR
jgi:hypothetical protein